MSSLELKENIKKFPFWKKLSDEEKKLVLKSAAIRSFKKEQIISGSDTTCMGIVYVLRGSLRISLMSEDGREITLYRLEENNSCVATASCVINQITFDTIVTAASDTILMIIPARLCSRIADSNVYVKEFILETEAERYSQSIWVVKQLLFKRMDQRLATYLVDRYEETGSIHIHITQEELSRDINSAREVVTKMLKHFTQEELVEVRRGCITLKNIEGLKNIIF